MSGTVLVTGGAGYIGSHACKLLARSGLEPVTYDNLERGHRKLVRWGPLEEGDILDQARLTAVCKRYRPRAVMHFAALAYVGESMAQPERYQRTNVDGGRTLLKAMAEAKVKRLVFSSTCAVYGEPRFTPITEDHPLAPVNPYGRTKAAMEQEIERWASAIDGEAIAFRYFNAAGADPEGEIGECHEPETHLVPLALQAAGSDENPVIVFGDDWPTPDGTCIRDYIHVTDLAEAHLLGLEYSEGPGGMRVFNLGNGRGYSVLEILEAASRMTGRHVPYRIGQRRPGDPPHLVGDASRALTLLGWKPRYHSLDEIIRTAWNWHRTSSDRPLPHAAVKA